MHTTNRRQLLLAATTLALPAWALAQAKAPLPPLQVWKDPNCGCCKDWVAYLQADGFSVQVHDTGNTAVRHRLGLPERYASCHTGLIDGYVIEGHVNAREIRRLLTEKPPALGLAVWSAVHGLAMLVLENVIDLGQRRSGLSVLPSRAEILLRSLFTAPRD